MGGVGRAGRAGRALVLEAGCRMYSDGAAGSRARDSCGQEATSKQELVIQELTQLTSPPPHAVAEHHQVRKSAGLFDVGHMVQSTCVPLSLNYSTRVQDLADDLFGRAQLRRTRRPHLPLAPPPLLALVPPSPRRGRPPPVRLDPERPPQRGRRHHRRLHDHALGRAVVRPSSSSRFVPSPARKS